MSWMQQLYETYNNCEGMIGPGSDDNKIPLLPICHTTQKAHIEITIDENGNFLKARLLRKEEARTIIPCTESSGGRTSGECAHPLCDKLQYVASDYKKYGGNKDSYFNSYVELLSRWASFDRNRKVNIIYRYVQKGSIIHDLIEHKLLFTDISNKLLKQRIEKKKDKETFDIFDLLPGRINKKGKIESWQADAFVRWAVEIPNDEHSSLWDDSDIWKSWIQYYSNTKQNKSLCYITGKEEFSADQHPAKIRNDGDKAKLISSGKSRSKNGEIRIDDSCGFTFLGRFTHPDQAATIGFEVTQQAHFALRWLIDRQGYRGKDGQAIVAWATSGTKIPQPTDDPLAILGFNDLLNEQEKTVSTSQGLALKLKKKIAGYQAELGDTAGVVVMGLDSATPGRMSITFYKELTGSDFLNQLDKWHEKNAWIHQYAYDKKTKSHFTFVGAPAPIDIAEAAFGSKADDRIKKSVVARILPCIIDGSPIPYDIVDSTVRRASNRVSQEEWEWNKTLSIACSLYKNYSKEDYNMALDENRNTRDYLYGRLLAIADRLEGHALYKAGERRDTNAARYMQLFAEHPFKTWKQIELALTPYKARLGGAHYYTKLIDEVMCKFSPEDFNSDKALSGEFLLGYHCQRADLWKDSAEEGDEKS